VSEGQNQSKVYTCIGGGGGGLLCAPYRVILDYVLHAPVSVSKLACRGSEKERRFLSNFFAEFSLGIYKLNAASKICHRAAGKGKNHCWLDSSFSKYAGL